MKIISAFVKCIMFDIVAIVRRVFTGGSVPISLKNTVSSKNIMSVLEDMEHDIPKKKYNSLKKAILDGELSKVFTIVSKDRTLQKLQIEASKARKFDVSGVNDANDANDVTVDEKPPFYKHGGNLVNKRFKRGSLKKSKSRKKRRSSGIRRLRKRSYL